MFMDLGKSFFERALNLIKDKNLNLEIILDGTLGHKQRHQCLAQFFRPLVKTFVDNDPLLYPFDKEIFSNDKEKGYDLFQGFKNFSSQLPNLLSFLTSSKKNQFWI